MRFHGGTCNKDYLVQRWKWQAIKEEQHRKRFQALVKLTRQRTCIVHVVVERSSSFQGFARGSGMSYFIPIHVTLPWTQEGKSTSNYAGITMQGCMSDFDTGKRFTDDLSFTPFRRRWHSSFIPLDPCTISSVARR